MNGVLPWVAQVSRHPLAGASRLCNGHCPGGWLPAGQQSTSPRSEAVDAAKDDIVQAASGAAHTSVNCASSITSAPAANDRPRHHIDVIVSVIYDARKPLRRA
jgi:hypothetical protein